MGDNKGVGGGLISTALLNKLAVSLTAGLIKPFEHKDASGIDLEYGNAYNYSLSCGNLIYPFKYKKGRKGSEFRAYGRIWGRIVYRI